MFNFTKAEINSVFFVDIILLVSAIYYLIAPTKSLQPTFDYSAMDSTFKRISREKLSVDKDSSISFKSFKESQSNQTKRKKTNHTKTPKKEPLLPSSININTASEKELQKLPRIGPAKAKLILEYRNKNGKFKNVEELLNIKGIGKKTLEKLEPYIFVE